jgi:hypothetical protein
MVSQKTLAHVARSLSCAAVHYPCLREGGTHSDIFGSRPITGTRSPGSECARSCVKLGRPWRKVRCGRLSLEGLGVGVISIDRYQMDHYTAYACHLSILNHGSGIKLGARLSLDTQYIHVDGRNTCSLSSFSSHGATQIQDRCIVNELHS